MATTHLVFFFFDGATASDAVAAALPEYREFALVVPPETPGPAPRINDAKLMSDRDFWALARIAELADYVEDVSEWAVAAGLADSDEVVDVFADDFAGDEDLFGRSGIGHRKPGRSR